MSDNNAVKTRSVNVSDKKSNPKERRTLTSFKKKTNLVGSSVSSTIFPKKPAYIKPVIPEYMRSVNKKEGQPLTYVFDSNIVMHHPDAIFKFDEHEVVLSGTSMEEFDNHKNSMGSDVGLNIRTTIRHLVDLVKNKKMEEIQDGLALIPPEYLKNGKPHTGKIFWDYSKPDISLCEGMQVDLDISKPDHRILLACLRLKKEGKNVVLISNDKILRILSANAGVIAEEYLSEVAEYLPASQEDVITGIHTMDEDFWAKIGENHVLKTNKDIVCYEFTHAMFKHVYVNQFIIVPGEVDSESETLLRVTAKPSPHKVHVETFCNNTHNKILLPKNHGQRFALELVMDKKVPCVVLDGPAGSGKTYVALAGALDQVMNGDYEKIMFTRALSDVDEPIGFLPGTEEEKMAPWLHACTDNIEAWLSDKDNKVRYEAEKGATAMSVSYIMEKYIEFKSLNYSRGRSIRNTIIINDESQNTKAGQMKTLTTRVGEGSKIIHLGNVAQIDNNFVTRHTCGLSVFRRKAIESNTSLVGAITLEGVVRSALAEWAEENL
jgi:PhoH-like ATPase